MCGVVLHVKVLTELTLAVSFLEGDSSLLNYAHCLILFHEKTKLTVKRCLPW